MSEERPSDEVDPRFTSTHDAEYEAAVHSWGRTARYLTQDYVDSAVLETDGHINIVDISSGYPFWAQMQREIHREDMRVTAEHIVGQTVAELDRVNMADLLTTPFGFTPEALAELKRSFSPRNSLFRQLTASAVHAVLTQPPEEVRPGNKRAVRRMRETLYHGLRDVETVQEKRFELEDMVGRGRWAIVTPQRAGLTLEQLLTGINYTYTDDSHPDEVLAQHMGAERADVILQFLAKVLTPLVMSHVRPFAVFSLDRRDPKKLHEYADASFSDSVRETEFYKRAGDMSEHIHAHPFILPFADSTITYLHSIEGFPFNFENFNWDTEANVRDFVYEVTRVLKPGGRAAFFPWLIKNRGEVHEGVLEHAEQLFAMQHGVRVVKESFEPYQIIRAASDAESILVLNSRVFEQTVNALTVLVVEKKAKSLSSMLKAEPSD